MFAHAEKIAKPILYVATNRKFGSFNECLVGYEEVSRNLAHNSLPLISEENLNFININTSKDVVFSFRL